MLHGECYCGEVTFTVDETSRDAALCHCITCQHIGSACSFNLVSQFDKITVTSDVKPKSYNDTKTKSGNPIVRYFCGNCGSTVFSVPVGGGAFVKVGALKEAKEFKLAMTIFEEDGIPALVTNSKK
ncbi:hypothetical protein EXIGLDRAFT_745380 [Exidia glandulosa HHB12029]|uniref:CENP-V/GFA domain-containing protein n=1 Tax=Exidia glandulosa HHB12029 TaxID=1314781 RepID=A0A166BGY3_EXIGL|nr:hypothetical protein EXIGLDRAFT_745380 [Exidia glandulosa HHB12029]